MQENEERVCWYLKRWFVHMTVRKVLEVGVGQGRHGAKEQQNHTNGIDAQSKTYLIVA